MEADAQGQSPKSEQSLNATQHHFEEERVCLVGVCFNVGLFLSALFCFFFSFFYLGNEGVLYV